MTNKKAEEKLLLETIIKGIEEVKGERITLLDLTKIENSICNYFVICHGNSNTQVDAIARSVQKMAREQCKEKPWHSEGLENSEWILLDYVNVVVHIFQKQVRDFYDIESLWGDAKVKEIETTY